MNDTLFVCGAYDGLSARLAEESGCDAVWASGFSIATSKSVPDRNVVSFGELVGRVSDMVDATRLPIIVDCDEGHGSLEVTLRLVRRLQRVGARGVCVEDNVFPKRNSFNGSHGRRLLDASAFCRKIEAMRESAPGMLLIARTEALIAGKSLDEAYERAVAYAAAGADYLLIHSTFEDGDEFRELASGWTHEKPLVTIPTNAIDVSFQEFVDMGYKMVIFANQVLRASIYAMRSYLSRVLESKSTSCFRTQMVSMGEIFDLVDRK